MLTTPTAVHPAILKRFQTLIQSNRLAHAYLFIGPRAVGKSETALAIARLLNCEDNTDAGHSSGCGECPACRKIDAGQHPDVTLLDAGEEESIKIAAIREVIQRLQLRPYEARKKVIVIKDAELMTQESGNAFLKTLEEPPKDTVILLTTSSPELLLSTTKSRCQHVNFFPAARAAVAQTLASEKVDVKEAHFLAGFTDGCLGRARELKGSEFPRRKDELIDQLVLKKCSDQYLKDLLGEKTAVREALEVLLIWFRDLVFVKAGADPQQLTNLDRWRELESLERAYSFTQLIEIISGIENSLKFLDENFNVKIAFYLLMEKIWVRS